MIIKVVIETSGVENKSSEYTVGLLPLVQRTAAQALFVTSPARASAHSTGRPLDRRYETLILVPPYTHVPCTWTTHRGKTCTSETVLIGTDRKEAYEATEGASKGRESERASFEEGTSGREEGDRERTRLGEVLRKRMVVLQNKNLGRLDTETQSIYLFPFLFSSWIHICTPLFVPLGLVPSRPTSTPKKERSTTQSFTIPRDHHSKKERTEKRECEFDPCAPHFPIHICMSPLCVRQLIPVDQSRVFRSGAVTFRNRSSALLYHLACSRLLYNWAAACKAARAAAGVAAGVSTGIAGLWLLLNNGGRACSSASVRDGLSGDRLSRNRLSRDGLSRDGFRRHIPAVRAAVLVH